MKILRKALSLILLFQLCFANLLISKAEYPVDAVQPYEIIHTYLYSDYPVVGEKFYVNVKAYWADIYTSESIDETEIGITYQWYKSDTDINAGGILIDGASSQYYIPQIGDVDKYLYCVVTGNEINYSGELTTRPSAFPVTETSQLNGALIILNDFYSCVGSEMTGYLFHNGSIVFDNYFYPAKSPIDIALTGDEIASYQWYRTENESNVGGTAITGATSYKYTPTADDFGYYLYFTAEGNENYSGTVTSTTTEAVCMMEISDGGTSGIAPPINLVKPIGATIKHATLTTDRGSRRNFQWYRNNLHENSGGEPILGATLYRYTLTSEDVGKYLYVTVPGENDRFTGNPLVSPVTEMVTDESPEITNISIAQNGYLFAQRHNKIEVTSTTPQSAVATVQWYRNDVQKNSGGDPILGATYFSYTPTSYDVGKYLYCVYTPVYPYSGASIASEVTDIVENRAVISFNPNGGQYARWNEEVNVGESCPSVEYADAFRSGYTFKGWATTSNAQTPDFTKETLVEEDITVYAVWEKIPTNSSSGGSSSTTYNIKFVTNGDNTINSQNIAKNEKATQPTAPVKNGFIFDGWYTDTALKHLYDFNTAVTGSLTLYAKWLDTANILNALWKENANEIHYIKGYSDNTFKPDQDITRYEMLEALSNLLDFKNDGSHNLTDVTADYDKLVALFTGAKIIDGYDDNTFKGTDGLTRAEFVKILSIILNLETKETTENKFTDISAHWAKDYINNFADSSCQGANKNVEKWSDKNVGLRSRKMQVMKAEIN